MRRGARPAFVAKTDETSNHHDGTYQNGPTHNAPGAVAGESDTAWSMDGVDDRMQSPTDTAFNADSFSIELWAMPDTLRVQGLVYKSYVDSWRLFMEDTSGHLKFDALQGTKSCATSGTDALAAGEYTHVVATYDKEKQEAKIYLDGSVEAECSLSDMGGDDTSPLLFGYVSVNEWDGLMDDIAYYDYALSPEAVAAHYGDTSTYEYDGVHQLKAVEYPDGDTETFTYDAMGNRKTRVFNGSTTNYTYNAGERMTAAGGVTYTYDDNGNLTDRGTADDFGWDHENRLTSTTIDSVSASYDYNGDGVRMSRTIGATTVDYTWDLSRGLPVVLEDDEGYRYVYGLDLISRTDSSDNQEYFLADGLGSTTALADDTGVVTDTYEYDVFGNVRAQTGSSGNEFTYAGEQTDGTGLQYLRARYYDPAVGRFLSRDRLPLLHRYQYVGNNPANLVDPNGLWPDISNPFDDAWDCATDPLKCGEDILEEGLEAADDALGVVPGWDEAVDATHDFLYGPYKDAGDWLVERFGTRACLSFALDAGASAALAFGGPAGVPVAAGLFAVGAGVSMSDPKEPEWFGLGASGAGHVVSPLALEAFTKYSPQVGRIAMGVTRITVAVSFASCVHGALR